MLKPAILFADQIQKKYREVWFNDKYKYYNYNSFWHTFAVEDNSRDWHEFVSVDANNEVVGYIHYWVDRTTLNCARFGAINFTDNPLFGFDLLKAIEDIFLRFNFHKLQFSVVIGNPVEKTYDRLCKKYGGRILCIEKEETKLEDNKYYDVKLYEILRDEFLLARGAK